MSTATLTQEPQGDLAWIEQTLNGNPDAFGNLVQKYRPKFLGMAIGILKSREEADDVLQDAFIQAYRHLPGFRNQSRFSTWFYSIVMNHIRNRLRHGRVLRWIPLEDSSDPEEPGTLNIAENAPSLDAALEQKFRVEAFHEAIDRLPMQYRSICILHYIQGMLLKDVAEKLDRPLGTIKVYLHRARKLLRKHLIAAEGGAPRLRAASPSEESDALNMN